jgi:basic amino acid/polyamine antiporter, APA family
VEVESVVSGLTGPGVRTAARDSGLVRVIGPLGLTAAIVNSVVGSAIFVVPAAMAVGAGSLAPLAFLACAVAMAPVVICFAAGGRRVPTSGGACGYVEAAFGPMAGFIAGTLLSVGCVLSCGGIVGALADGATGVLPPAFATAARALVILGTLGLMTVVNVNGAASGTRLVEVGTVLKLIPLFVFIFAGALALHGTGPSLRAIPPAEGFGRAMILALFAFAGMEVPLSASGEIVKPARTIPRALFAAMIFVTVLYISIQVIAQGLLGPALVTSHAPLAEAMRRIHPALRVLLLAGASVSMLAWLGSDFLGTPRLLFAFARDGLLPAVLGRLHARTHAPYVAIICYAGIAAVLALTGTFSELVVLAALTFATLYLLSCAAVWVLASREAVTTGPRPALRWLSLAGAIGIASMSLVIALATWMEIVGLGATIGIGTLGYLLAHLVWRRAAQSRR